MSWGSASEFFAMGGYGVYVWGAYAVTAACMLIDPVQAARRHRRALATARAEAEAEEDATTR